MRFVTFTTTGATDPAWVLDRDAGTRVGVQRPDGTIHALAPGRRLVDLLGTDSLAAALDAPSEVFATADVRLLPPVPAPPSVRDFMTFEQHVAGAVRNRDPEATVAPAWYEVPTFYFSNPAGLVGAHDPVPMPPGCARLDLELEVAVVIGRPGTNITVADALSHVAGYTLLNDWSARDLQWHEMRIGLGPAKGKDTATTLGPALVTPDELDGVDVGLRAYVNDELLGSDSLSHMHWSFAQMIAYASRGTWLRTGDVLGSGTCGDGCLAELWGNRGQDARPSLQVGDRVRLEADVLGAVDNEVVAGVPPTPL
ncbi:MAG: fumarylacetoacetate hydrolase family protein [Rhodoferax sp.]|nr:fumarylacetoacetate hydrolase family protein [Actinomycetota bacterium]